MKEILQLNNYINKCNSNTLLEPGKNWEGHHNFQNSLRKNAYVLR